MDYLKIHHDIITNEIANDLCALCPFTSISYTNGQLVIDSSCRMCGICVKNGPTGAITMESEGADGADGTDGADVEKTAAVAFAKADWSGIAVFAEYQGGAIHPVTWELIGKARELANRSRQVDDSHEQVIGLLIGGEPADTTLNHLREAVDGLYVCCDPELEHFRVEPYANAFAAFIESVRPSVVLVGATHIGRTLAPRVAARFRTGITADCTALEMRDNSDLVQIRPAFGGNVMAQIITPRHRPQFCTVRYKVFSELAGMQPPVLRTTPFVPKGAQPPVLRTTPFVPKGAGCAVRRLALPADSFCCGVRIMNIEPKPAQVDIAEAKRIVAVGRGIGKKEDLAMVEEFARLLDAQVACTRPLIENGWFDPRRQIGLSGRTVSADLIITIGISGSVQFAAGMRGSKCIISINKDPAASIFSIAHYAAVGDLYKILPALINKINK